MSLSAQLGRKTIEGRFVVGLLADGLVVDNIRNGMKNSDSRSMKI